MVNEESVIKDLLILVQMNDGDLYQVFYKNDTIPECKHSVKELIMELLRSPEGSIRINTQPLQFK